MGDLLDAVGRRVGAVTGGQEVVRLGVTGLSRAGKTVFITALVANLLDRARMTGLRAEAEGRIEAVFLQPQPDDTVPRFDFETHLAALGGADAHWPESTRAISELRLSIRLAPRGLVGMVRGARVLHLDIVDYPGEWLLDLALMGRSYDDWSRETLERMRDRDAGRDYLDAVAKVDPAARLEEPVAKALADLYTRYLAAARQEGYSDATPGRFLLPGDLAGSPALTFAPLAAAASAGGRGSLGREFARRYGAYKAQVVTPFFRDHFARIDRQIVLADLLGAMHGGPRAVENMRQTLAAILAAFRPGKSGWLASILGRRRIGRILFAATKADHLHHGQHKRLTALMAALVREARARADFAGAETAAMAIASLRVTSEEVQQIKGRKVDCVRGRLEDGRYAAFHPGDMPDNPAEMMKAAEAGGAVWPEGDYAQMRFLPPSEPLRAGAGLPHVRIDKALEFLLGDRL
ncbi:MAG: YcjX family protein [Paracoccaceae bacterium]